MQKRLYPKPLWQEAVGKHIKPKRLSLPKTFDGRYTCPLSSCDSEKFKSQRGCRKHVFNKHGWFYFFEKKPVIEEVFPQHVIKRNSIEKTKQSCTSKMPSFSTSCQFSLQFGKWMQTPGGGAKSSSQSNQIVKKVLKFAKFCCQDSDTEWEVPDNVIEYCIGTVPLISDFVSFLQNEWHLGNAGLIGYMTALSHLLDFIRSKAKSQTNLPALISAEVYLDRVKKSIRKKMKLQWNELLSINFLSSINCWASLEDMQKVIPYHADRFTQIMINVGHHKALPLPTDLSFSTAFVVCVLFILVKAARPMTYQYLTVSMVQELKGAGIIDQTKFKTNTTYSFDSLYITEECFGILNGYIKCIRCHLSPSTDYLLISRNGKQLSQLSNVFGRMVYQAIGKYISPTRYRQIIETTSASHLTHEEQRIISQDQKHSSNVAKVHYQKLQSHAIAEKGHICMEKMKNTTVSEDSLKAIHFEINSDVDILPTSPTTTSNALPSLNVTERPQRNANECNILHFKREKKAKFSTIEDKFLMEGIQKYGIGKWTHILKDPLYKFHPSRRASTLFGRAKILKIM